MMSKGISIHIGLNHVDPKHYQGWDGELNACIADAKDMRALAKKKGFAGNALLVDGQATAAKSAIPTATRRTTIAWTKRGCCSIASWSTTNFTTSGPSSKQVCVF